MKNRKMERLKKVYSLVSAMASEAAKASKQRRMDHAREREAADIVK